MSQCQSTSCVCDANRSGSSADTTTAASCAANGSYVLGRVCQITRAESCPIHTLSAGSPGQMQSQAAYEFIAHSGDSMAVKNLFTVLLFAYIYIYILALRRIAPLDGPIDNILHVMPVVVALRGVDEKFGQYMTHNSFRCEGRYHMIHDDYRKSPIDCLFEALLQFQTLRACEDRTTLCIRDPNFGYVRNREQASKLGCCN